MTFGKFKQNNHFIGSSKLEIYIEEKPLDDFVVASAAHIDKHTISVVLKQFEQKENTDECCNK